MSDGFVWVKPPSSLIGPLHEYGEKCLAAVYAIASYVGQQMQDEARRAAKWEDRTGNARSGLFFAVDGFGMGPIVGNVDVNALSQADRAVISGTSDRLVLALSHTMWYGKYLELSNGGRYAVVMSTMERNLPRLERMLKQTFEG
jgi:hypothetical protein